MIEAVTAKVAVFAEIEINLCVLRQPDGCIFLWKRHRTVFHDLMLTQKSNFRNRIHHLSFDPHDLGVVSGDPRPSLQGNWVSFLAELIGVNMVRAIGTLSKVDQPRCLSMPVAKPFA